MYNKKLWEINFIYLYIENIDLICVTSGSSPLPDEPAEPDGGGVREQLPAAQLLSHPAPAGPAPASRTWSRRRCGPPADIPGQPAAAAATLAVGAPADAPAQRWRAGRAGWRRQHCHRHQRRPVHAAWR